MYIKYGKVSNVVLFQLLHSKQIKKSNNDSTTIIYSHTDIDINIKN